MSFPDGVVVARPQNFQIQRGDNCRKKVSEKRQPREPTVIKTVPNNQQSTMEFPNGVVVARPPTFQIQRQDICEEKISYKRQPREPAVVKTVPNNQQSTVNFPNGIVVARPLNFQIQRQDICEEKISYKRQPREPAEVKTVPNNQQSRVNFPNGIVVAKPLNFQIQRQDICEENNEACGEEDSNAQFLPKEVDDTTTDVVLCVESASVIQEIDVVVHPSILQPTEKSKNIKKIGKQQGVGVEKRRKSKPRECKECGKILASTTTYLEHMNIHYDRRPYKCGVGFLERYGWLIVIGLVILVFLWSKLKPYWKELQNKWERQQEIANFDPIKAASQQERMEDARRRLQEKQDAKAAKFMEDQRVITILYLAMEEDSATDHQEEIRVYDICLLNTIACGR
ncbi:hypothetical protein AWC38_SpisGene16873 [Stylophora pistillata]|uniref:C2H2-type domain-containing protein n=1 Tax=Stylophora pistillata TaxID=50429 RepID=A0A2B4RK07_STYPI|nr:hypothetical protein AWC38_SpisGene16873 [Stylophora pistillata]